MGIEISLKDLNVSGNAEILGNAKIRGSEDVHISLEHAEIGEYSKVLNNLEIDTVLNELKKQAQFMDKNSAEYAEVKELINQKQWNKNDFIRCAIKHISEFSQGVLASIIANYITR